MDSHFSLVSSLLTGTSTAIPANSLNYVYMVRAIVHDQTVGGVNYDNASQGVFAQPDAGGGGAGAMAAAPAPADDPDWWQTATQGSDDGTDDPLPPTN
jgi:hypothetical protein